MGKLPETTTNNIDDPHCNYCRSLAGVKKAQFYDILAEKRWTSRRSWSVW
jgi:hypothetical protein